MRSSNPISSSISLILGLFGLGPFGLVNSSHSLVHLMQRARHETFNACDVVGVVSVLGVEGCLIAQIHLLPRQLLGRVRSSVRIAAGRG